MVITYFSCQTLSHQLSRIFDDSFGVTINPQLKI